MTLSTPRTVFGVHSLTLFNRADFTPYGTLKVLGNLNFALSGDFVDLFGGSSRYAWDSEAGTIDTSLSGTIKEIPDFSFEKFLGATATATAAEATGNVGTLTNKKGTSVMSATTGIASATAKAGSETDLKDGFYVVKCTGAAAVDVYCMSDVDFDTGTDKTFETDLLKVTATPLTITTGVAVAIPGFGVELTGGSGTIGMTTGDTAYFFVRKINTGSSIITIGAANLIVPEFGAVITSQKKADGNTFEIVAYRCKAIGLPMPLTEKDWLNADVTIKALYDSTENCVAKIRAIKG